MKLIKYTFFSLLFTALLFACGPDKKEEVINMDDITPHSERYKEGKEKKEQTEDKGCFADSLPELYTGIIDSLKLKHELIQKVDSFLFLDRFHAKSEMKLCWKLNGDSINFFHWNFKDSIKTKTALFNWLDCFGSPCKSIRIREKVNFQKRTMLLLINENNMIYIDSDKKIDQLKWLEVLKDQKIGENWKYIISQPKKGKAKWTELKDEIETEIVI